MARVYRPTYTIPIPDGAELIEREGERFARFRRGGKRVTAPLTKSGKHAGKRVLVESATWSVAYTDAAGRERYAKGYADKRATAELASTLQTAVDRELAGIIDTESVERSDALRAGLSVHVEAYTTHLRASGVSAWHLSETTRRLDRVVEECGFGRLLDVKAEPVQRWVSLRRAENMGARTLNTYVGSLRAFVRWAVAVGRLAADPLETLARADEASDVRRERRALTESEFVKLLDTAERRPVLDATIVRRGKRKGEAVGKLKPETRTRLERLGRERRLIYSTLVLTGLRRGELAGLKWADVSLDGPQAWLTVPASLSKNGKTESLPVRADLVAELRAWRDECGEPNDDTTVFRVPKALSRILANDLKAADIDPTGVDVHSLRHTTATYLAKAGVAPRTAQAMMRHSDIRLTLGTYTDPRLLDTAGSLYALPSLRAKPDTERQRATGTCSSRPDALVVSLVGKERPRGQNGSRTCAATVGAGGAALATQPVGNARVISGIQRHSGQRANGLEPSTFSLEG